MSCVYEDRDYKLFKWQRGERKKWVTEAVLLSWVKCTKREPDRLLCFLASCAAPMGNISGEVVAAETLSQESVPEKVSQVQPAAGGFPRESLVSCCTVQIRLLVAEPTQQEHICHTHGFAPSLLPKITCNFSQSEYLQLEAP